MNTHTSCYFSILGMATLTFLASCTFLPSSGPSLSRVKSNSYQKKAAGEYVLIPITKQTLDVLDQNAATAESARAPLNLITKSTAIRHMLSQGQFDMQDGKPSNFVVQGDTLNVTIFDSGGSLFASPVLLNGLSETGAIRNDLPPQIVDTSGEITIPFAGRIKARGRTLGEIQNDIQNNLKGKAVSPQVIVSISSRMGGDCVSVLGDVKTPSRVEISLAGTRLLDALAQAGGSLGKEYETFISVTRGETMRTALLSEIFETPSKNILLRYGDTVVARVRLQNFLNFGASGRLAEIPFDEDHLTLAKALAKVGGADDSKADPSGILIYRLEPRERILEMGITPVGNDATCPVIYRLNLTHADGFFLARSFTMRDHDIIYVTSAGSIGVQKFLSTIGSILSPVSQSGSTAALAARASTAGL